MPMLNPINTLSVQCSRGAASCGIAGRDCGAACCGSASMQLQSVVLPDMAVAL